QVVDQAVIENRRPYLERVRHRQRVGVVQDLIDQQVPAVELECAIDGTLRRQFALASIEHPTARYTEARREAPEFVVREDRKCVRQGRVRLPSVATRERRLGRWNAREVGLVSCVECGDRGGRPVEEVGTEQLVGTVSRERHLQLLAHLRRDEPAGQNGGV